MRTLIGSAVLILASCGGATPPDSPSDSAHEPHDPPRVTLTDDGCVGDSTGAVSGMAIITVQNDTSTGAANFELVQLRGTFEDADQFLRDVRDGTEPAPGELPFIADELDRAFVERGQTGELAAELPAATYAVVCVPLDEGDDIITAYVVGPYTVGE